MPIDVEQTAALRPGEAMLRVTGHAGLDPHTTRLCIEQPGATPRYVQPRAGEEGWGPTKAWFAPARAESAGDVLSLLVGPDVTWHLRANVTYRVYLADASGETAQPDRMAWKAIRLPSQPPAPLPEPEPEPAVEAQAAIAEADAAIPTPVVADEILAALRPEAPVRGLSGFALAALGVGAVLLLAIGGALVWRYMNLDAPTEQAAEATPVAPPEPSAQSARPPAPADVPAIPRNADGARAYLRTNPPAAEAHAQAEGFLAQGTDDARQGAVLLLDYAASKGVASAATTIGKMYDPSLFAEGASAIREPDAALAVLWYGRAAKSDDPEALYRLGILVSKGLAEDQGMPRASGRDYLEKAARLGHGDAAAALAAAN